MKNIFHRSRTKVQQFRPDTVGCVLEARRLMDGGATAEIVAGYGWVKIQATEASERITLTSRDENITIEVRSAEDNALQNEWTYGISQISFVEIFAGNGNDEIRIDANLGNAVVHAFGQIGDDLIIGGDSLGWYAGNEGNDTILGGNASEILTGEEGDDSILGGGGNDFILGWEGEDTLYGGLGDDTIYGGPAQDVLDGNEGVNLVFQDDANNHGEDGSGDGGNAGSGGNGDGGNAGNGDGGNGGVFANAFSGVNANRTGQPVSNPGSTDSDSSKPIVIKSAASKVVTGRKTGSGRPVATTANATSTAKISPTRGQSGSARKVASPGTQTQSSSAATASPGLAATAVRSRIVPSFRKR